MEEKNHGKYTVDKSPCIQYMFYIIVGNCHNFRNEYLIYGNYKKIETYCRFTLQYDIIYICCPSI